MWLKDWWNILTNELKMIFSDWGVLLIFLVAGLIYPLLYNIVYYNGILNETPIAVVDESGSALSRRFTREVDATREVKVVYHCATMGEAQQLMQERKAFGIMYFPEDYDKKIMAHETASVSIYCDMSSFLYYKNAMMAANHVLLDEMDTIQGDNFRAAGFTDQQIEELTHFIPYEENNPYNRAFSYSIFLVSVILLIIIQQTMFYGMSLLAGTMRERNRSFASLPDTLQGHGMCRVVLGRGSAYGLLYMIISLYIMLIVPAIFGLPQRGDFWDLMILALFFVTDCVFFSMFWSTFITRRESVFILFLFMSPICLFLTGTSWPAVAFPKFWSWFSYLFPTTFGCKAFINMSVAGGGLAEAAECFFAMTIQIIVYFLLANIAVMVENKLLYASLAKNLNWKSRRYIAPQVTQLSAKLNTGSKNLNGCPPSHGTQSGHTVSIRGK